MCQIRAGGGCIRVRRTSSWTMLHLNWIRKLYLLLYVVHALYIFGKGEEPYIGGLNKPLETMDMMWWLNQWLLSIEGILQSQTKWKTSLSLQNTLIYIYIYICIYIYIYIYMNLTAYETVCLSIYNKVEQIMWPPSCLVLFHK